MLVLLFMSLASVNSFLLDNPQGNGGTATTNQYLTLSKFYEEMKLQQQDTTKLRHDTDNSLTLLTSQLQQKFDLLDKKLADIERHNETILDAANLEQKYKQLEQRYLNLEQNFHTLKVENNLLQNKKDELEHKVFSLQNETKHQAQELAVLKTKSLLVDQNIENLKHLGSIQPLQELQTLQQEVKSIYAQASSLIMKEQARSQDFMALYSKVQEQGVTSNRSITDLDTRMKILQTNHTKSITDLGTELKIYQKNQSTVLAEIEVKMHDESIRDNQTFIKLQRQIDTSMELVAMTAHPSTSGSIPVGILKFDYVKFSVGINNLSVYKRSGKFVCEKDGLYLISTSIRSDTNSAYYYIYLNGDIISKTIIGFNSNSPLQANGGTVVLTQQLHSNDSVWIYYPQQYHLLGKEWSTFTIAKIR